MSDRGRGRPVDPETPKRKIVSFRMLEDLYERAQNTCHARRIVLTRLIERKLEAWVKEQEMQYNDGIPFPSRHEDTPV